MIDEQDKLNHLAYNVAALSRADKLRGFDQHFPKRPAERVEVPPLEDRIREAWTLHGIEPPPGYEHLKNAR